MRLNITIRIVDQEFSQDADARFIFPNVEVIDSVYKNIAILQPKDTTSFIDSLSTEAAIMIEKQVLLYLDKLAAHRQKVKESSGSQMEGGI